MEGEIPRNTTDPSLDPSHLTPDGKRRHRRIDRGAQRARYERAVDDRANEIIPQGVTSTPGDNLKPKLRKIIGIDD